MPTTFVLVHGAGCNAASWTPTLRELTLRGHRALAVDLPGHGFGALHPDPGAFATAPSGMAGIGTADDVALVTDVLRRASAHGPVVLVGHSRGGLALTATANAVPELISRLVYVSAWCPVDRGVGEYMALPEHAGSYVPRLGVLLAGDPTVLGALRFDWRTSDPAHLDLLQEGLLADGTRAELLAYLHTQDPDESILVDDEATRAKASAWGRVPHTYVRLTGDRAIPPAVQDLMIAEADALTPDNPFTVRSLDSSHLRVQIHPEELVDVLESSAV